MPSFGKGRGTHRRSTFGKRVANCRCVASPVASGGPRASALPNSHVDGTRETNKRPSLRLRYSGFQRTGPFASAHHQRRVNRGPTRPLHPSSFQGNKNPFFTLEVVR